MENPAHRPTTRGFHPERWASRSRTTGPVAAHPRDRQRAGKQPHRRFLREGSVEIRSRYSSLVGSSSRSSITAEVCKLTLVGVAFLLSATGARAQLPSY